MTTALPAQAASSNPILGSLDPAAPGANAYAGCVASLLTGDGFVFGSSAALGTELAAVWASIPDAAANACRQAVLSGQPQVCVNPADANLCPNVGSAAETLLAARASAVTGTWKIIPDVVGGSGLAQTPIDSAALLWTPMAAVSGTFKTPVTVCTSASCTPQMTGLWANCGTFTCGEVKQMMVSFRGRTPAVAGLPGGENAVLAHMHAVDGHGFTLFDGNESYGSDATGAGCGGPEPHECTFNGRVVWNCVDANRVSANCGSQTLAVSFTFTGGSVGGVTPVPTLAQQVQMSLTTSLLDWHQNPTVCPAAQDCMRYDDSRVNYGGPYGDPTVVDYAAAPVPSAVINLDPRNLDCLVGLNVLSQPGARCTDATHALATVVQVAHALIVPAAPPSASATLDPAAGPTGWFTSPVKVSIKGTDPSGPGVASLGYRAEGAQSISETAVAGDHASVTIGSEGRTTLTYWATDLVGGVSDRKTLTVQLDLSPPAFACAAPDTAWHATDVSLACTAGDALSGLADPSLASFHLATSIAPGSESADARTGSQLLCDKAGKCVTAGPIGGIKVDRKPPTVKIDSPAGAYSLDQKVVASFHCNDPGSGVARCAGTVEPGSAIDTRAPGSFTFTVDAADAVGNTAEQTSMYTVGYALCDVRVAQQRSHRRAAVRFRLSLCNAGEDNLDDDSIAVTATGIFRVATGETLPIAGRGWHGGRFRLEDDGYAIDLQTAGLTHGDYRLLFRISGDPTKHSVAFQVR